MNIEIIKIAHRQGKISVEQTKDWIEKDYYIPKLENKVAETVNSCVLCIVFIVFKLKLGKKKTL